MGTFRVTIELGDPRGERYEPLEVLVDSGSSYTWVPRTTLERLGVTPDFAREFELADGRVITRDMTVTMVRLNGQALPTLVIFGDRDTEPLLGAYTLEGFGLAPDPVNRRLVPVRGLLKRQGSSGSGLGRAL